MGMVQCTDRLRFAFEAASEFGALRIMSRQHFYGNCAVQPRVDCFIYLTHTACAQRRKDFVRSKLRAGFEWHSCADYTGRLPDAPNRNSELIGNFVGHWMRKCHKTSFRGYAHTSRDVRTENVDP